MRQIRVRLHSSNISEENYTVPVRSTGRVSRAVREMKKIAAILLIFPLICRAVCFGIAFAFMGFCEDFKEAWKNGKVE